MFKKILSITMILVLVLTSASFAFVQGNGKPDKINKEVQIQDLEGDFGILLDELKELIEGDFDEAGLENILDNIKDLFEDALENDEELAVGIIEELKDIEEEEFNDDLYYLISELIQKLQEDYDNLEEDSDEDGNIEDTEKEKGMSNGKGRGIGLSVEWRKHKEDIKDKRIEIQELKQEIEELESDEGLEKLQIELIALQLDMDELKEGRKEMLFSIKEEIRMNYSDEELEELEEVKDQLKEKYKGIKVLPVENVISSKGLLKFDVPPVIKEGRTLIPVRAISEGFGAKVEWNSKTKTVTITKDDITITLQLDAKIATVNNEEVELDVAAELMNNRTVLPLRFIAEELGLVVDFEAEDFTIEID